MLTAKSRRFSLFYRSSSKWVVVLLNDCRANGLENAVKDKDELIGSLRKEVDELRAVKIETPEDAREDEIRQVIFL